MASNTETAAPSMDSVMELVEKFEQRIAELEQSLEVGAQEKRSWEQDKKLFQLVADHVEDLIEVVDSQGRLIWNNRAYDRVLGYQDDEQHGGNSMLNVHPEDQIRVAGAFADTLKNGSGARIEYRMRHNSGSWVTLESQGRAVHDDAGNIEYVILVARDISSRKAIEEERAKNRRIETVNAMAQGIAQEFNDVISGMRGYISSARQVAPPGTPVLERLREAERVAQRAGEIMQRLSFMTNKGDAQAARKVLAPGPLLREIATETTRNTVARCEFLLPDSLYPIGGEEESIRRVLDGILTNAAQSMKSLGVIRVIAENITILPGRGDNYGVEPGHYVRINIMDQGEGISEGNLPRIFDPYFTTRPNGVGLGLTTALSIVKRAKGNILVQSTLNVGTTVTILWPCESPSALVTEPEISKPSQPVQTIRGTVLIMDDEPLVREFAAAAFQHLGYEVTLTNDGAQAIAAYAKARARGKPHDLVFLDLMVPNGVGGMDAYQTLLKMNPELKVIMASGHVDHPVMKYPDKHGVKAVLIKPYSIKKVQEVIEKILLV